MSTIAPTAASTMPPLPGIAHETITARTPPQVAARTVGGAGSSGSGGLRHRITSWMEDHLGRAAMPVAALAGGALLGTVGMLSLGPIGAAVGGAVGAFAGAALYLSD